MRTARTLTSIAAAIFITVVIGLGAAFRSPAIGELRLLGMLKESASPSASVGYPCPLEPNLTGDCANLRYYNLCSGYIWVWSLPDVPGETVGVRFDGPCIAEGNSVDKAITYWRNITPGYGDVDVFLDVDVENDGCPDWPLAQDLDLDPGLRWNCSTFGTMCIPAQAQALIVRVDKNGGAAPTYATDGPFTQECDPVGTPHSYYYGINASACQIWIGPTGRYDNFLYWLIVDQGCPTDATTNSSWGEIKTLFR